jgi:arylamine N-acetyltransferase
LFRACDIRGFCRGSGADGASDRPGRAPEHRAGASWHADVGFARGILEPIPFGPGPIQEQSGWSFRVVEDGSEFVLQKLAGNEWADVYGFLPQPVPLIDVETSNWWTSTHPRSLLVTGLIVGVRGDDGTARCCATGASYPSAS